MVESVVRLHTLSARDVMIPRVDVQTMSIKTNSQDIEFLLEDKGSYSRIPVYEGGIDNVRGILHIKDLYTALSRGKKGNIELEKIISTPYFVPESKKVVEILKEFQRQHLHMAVVVDEYGGFSGILTLEDIIEEIIGEVQDEFDTEQEDIKEMEEGVYHLDARTPLGSFNERFGTNLNTTKAETIGGYLIATVGYIPKLHQKIELGDYVLKPIEKRRNSLVRLKMYYSGKELSREIPSSEGFLELDANR